MPGTHAKLSPSGSSRWLNCPGSIRLTANLESKSSDAAFRGTVIHQAGENILRGIECHPGISIVIEGESKAEWLTKEMFEEADNYAKYVFDLIKRDPEGEIIPEMKIDLTEIAPDTFGHSDAVAIENRTLHIIDLKSGAGLVDAKDNTQLMLYAYGAFREFEMFYDIENIVLHIVQNNARTGDKTNSHTLTAEELLEWAIDVAIPGAKLALTDDAPCIPGDKQCQWCQAASFCPALIGEIEEMFEEIADPLEGSNETFDADNVPFEKALRLYEDLKLVDIWKRAIGNRIQSELELGNPVTGYKLVKKVKHKKWVDEIEAYDRLKGWEKLDDIAPRKLITPNQAEKVLGKMTAPKRAKFEELWIRPEGELTVAPESDKRPAQQAVINMFDDVVDAIDEDDEL